MPIITAADLAVMEPKIINRARMTAEWKTLSTQVFSTDPLKPGAGRTKYIPKYGSGEAYDADEGVEVDNPQSVAVQLVQATPTEIVAQALLTDIAVRVGGEDHAARIGEILGNAVRRRVDKRGLAMFDTYTNQLGGDAVASSLNYVSAASTILEGGVEPPDRPFYMVLRPEPMRNILNALVPTGTDNAAKTAIDSGFSEEVVRDYFRADLSILGVNQSFVSSNISRAGGGNNPSSGAVFSKSATVYIPATELEIEKSRRMKARGWLYQATQTFTFVHQEPAWGVRLRFASATPTS